MLYPYRPLLYPSRSDASFNPCMLGTPSYMLGTPPFSLLMQVVFSVVAFYIRYEVALHFYEGHNVRVASDGTLVS